MNKKTYMYVYDLNNNLIGNVYIKENMYILSFKNINSFFKNIPDLLEYAKENFNQIKILPFKLF